MNIARWTFLLAIFIASPTRADVLRFQEGGEVSLPITQEKTDVVLDTPMGLVRFPRSDFREIGPGSDPKREWPERWRNAKEQGSAEQYDAAMGALDQGLVTEAEQALRESHQRFPNHEPTRRLVESLKRLDQELPDPDLAAIRRGLPNTMKTARGPHVVVIHADTEEAGTERVAHLEQIIKAYYLYFGSIGFDLAAPKQKLASIWFPRHDDYLAFLRDEGATAFLNTRGYHYPARGCVVAYDCRDDPPRRTAREAIAKRRSEIDALKTRVAAMPKGARIRIAMEGAPTKTLGRKDAEEAAALLSRQVDRQDMMLELSRREIDLGVAAHETIHQLVVVSRLGKRADRFPNWLNEGLAIQFETIRGGRWAGLADPSPLRLRDYRLLANPPSLENTLSDVSQGKGYDRDSYAKAWALTYHLRRNRPAMFVALLDALRIQDESQGAPGAEAAVGRFRKGLTRSGATLRYVGQVVRGVAQFG